MSEDVPGQFWHGDDGLHVDTRGLSPPDPLVAVLWHITQPGQGGPVFVYFDRDPIHLFPELAEHGWRYEYGKTDAESVLLILSPQP